MNKIRVEKKDRKKDGKKENKGVWAEPSSTLLG